MKTSNVNQGRAHPEAIIRGWVSNKRAGSTAIGTSDVATVIAATDNLYLTRRGGAGHYLVTETASGTALTLVLASGNWFDITLTANCTIALDATGLPSGVGLEWMLILRQDSTGSRTVTWPAAVDWQDPTTGVGGGSAPTLYTAATAEDVIVITTLDGGVSYGGGQERSGGGAGVTYGTPAIVLGMTATAGSIDEAIRRDSTILAFDATVPVTQAFGDSAATGAAAVAARRDHKHAMPANPVTAAAIAAVGGVGELLLSDSASSPVVFGDILQNEAQTDLMYADIGA